MDKVYQVTRNDLPQKFTCKKISLALVLKVLKLNSEDVTVRYAVNVDLLSTVVLVFS